MDMEQVIGECSVNNDRCDSCYGLVSVDLHSNSIQNLIPLKDVLENSLIDIKVSSWEKEGISIRNNSPNIVPPYEVLNEGKFDFLLYIKQLEFEDKLNLPIYYNNEIKVILVGTVFTAFSS